MKLKHVNKTIGITLLLFLLLTACSLTEIREEEKITYKFGTSFMTLNNPYFVALNDGIKDIVEANGDILIALDPALDSEKQIEQIYDLISQDVDAIFICPVDWEAISPALVAASEAGIPIINVDSPVRDVDLVASVITSDNYNAGVLCAEDMMQKLDHAKIVILEHPTAKSSIDRIQGFIDTIEGMDQYEVVARESSEGQLEQAMEAMTRVLQEEAEIDVIMALNDPTAMGALAAIQDLKREDDILLYGVDGAPEAKQLIEDDKMTATAAQSPLTMGVTAAENAYDIIKGTTVEKEIKVEVFLIDKYNVNEYGTTTWQ
jgi:ribose transport system substrate-binding protein